MKKIDKIINELKTAEKDFWWYGNKYAKLTLIDSCELIKDLEKLNQWNTMYRLKHIRNIEKFLENATEIYGGNTCNFNGRYTHDFYYHVYEQNNGYYVEIAFHIAGDVRSNYTDELLFKLDCNSENAAIYIFWGVIQDLVRNQTGEAIEIDGLHFCIDFFATGDDYQIYCMEREESIEAYTTFESYEEAEKFIKEEMATCFE